jgi:hypothetical protein
MLRLALISWKCSFIEEDWEETIQISQGYEYNDLQTEDW